ncbi:MAG: hypothetical protein ACRC14_09300 [Paracoccaceae bacterium]
MAGRYEDLSREYIAPLAVYLGEQLVVMQTAENIMQMMADLHKTLIPMALSALTVKVTSVELPRSGKFRIWARWNRVSSDPAHTGHCDVVYYMRDTLQGYRTEMMHYVQVFVLHNYEQAPRLRA